MERLEFGGLHPDFRRLLNIARDGVVERKKVVGIAYLSSERFYFGYWHDTSKVSLSEQIVSGDFFERKNKKIPVEQRSSFFSCIGVYAEKLDPELNSEIESMFTISDGWSLPIYWMKKNGDVWRINPNDEGGRDILQYQRIGLL